MMPISSAAPITGRDIFKRVLLGLYVAFGALLAAVPATAAPAATPTPGPVVTPLLVGPAPPGAMGYYMMQGNRIISAPYSSGPDCMKAVTAFVKTLPPNIAPIVCAHRRP